MILPDLAHKSKIILVENVTDKFASMYSKFYPNIVFFTSDQNIWKNGICYSQPITVDPNQNKIYVDDLTYELQLEKNVLKFTVNESLYWGIFGDNGEAFFDAPDITRYNIKGQHDNGFGWRKITENKKIILGYLNELAIDEQKIYNPFSKIKPAEFPNNDLYVGPIFDIRDRDNLFLSNLIKLNKKVKKIHLFIPKKIIEWYHVGIYDDLDGSNLLQQQNNDGNLVPYINMHATNFANKFKYFLDESKFEVYIHYEIEAKSLMDSFSLRIYSKDSIIDKINI